MIKCARTACNAMIDSVFGGGLHKHNKQRYCISCSRKINELNGEIVIEFPRSNMKDPNQQLLPRKSTVLDKYLSSRSSSVEDTDTEVSAELLTALSKETEAE